LIQILAEVILPVFLVVGVGYGATRAGIFTPTDINGIMKLTQTVAIPCLLFRAISTLDLSTSFNPFLLFSYFSAAALCFAIGLIGARLIFRRSWEDSVVIGFCCLFSNMVLLGLPITERAYGTDSLSSYYAIVSLHSPFCFLLGVTAMEIVRNRGKGGMTMIGSTMVSLLKNPLVMSIGLGFIFNFVNVSLPGAIDDAMALIALAGLPAALFTLGGVLVQYRPEGDLNVIAFVVAISLLGLPALVWVFGTALSLPAETFRIAVLNGSMAPGFNAYLFANMYGHAKRVAATSVLLATCLSLFTVWFWLSLLG